jgi:hypothetical protein
VTLTRFNGSSAFVVLSNKEKAARAGLLRQRTPLLKCEMDDFWGKTCLNAALRWFLGGSTPWLRYGIVCQGPSLFLGKECAMELREEHRSGVRKCTMPRWGVKAKPLRGRSARLDTPSLAWSEERAPDGWQKKVCFASKMMLLMRLRGCYLLLSLGLILRIEILPGRVATAKARCNNLRAAAQQATFAGLPAARSRS